MAAEPLGISSVFQAGREAKTKGENHFFFSFWHMLFYFERCNALLGPFAYVWPEMSHVTNLATVETGTSGWLSSLYKKKVTSKGLGEHSLMSATLLSITSPEIP